MPTLPELSHLLFLFPSFVEQSALLPSDLANDLQRLSSALDSRRCLGSAATGTVVGPPTRLSLSLSLSLSQPSATGLSPSPQSGRGTVCQQTSLNTFRQLLKTELFTSSFLSPNPQSLRKRFLQFYVPRHFAHSVLGVLAVTSRRHGTLNSTRTVT